MSNEFLFITQPLVLILFSWICLRRGIAALTAAFCIEVILANLFVIKEITLFGLSVTATDVFTIGSLFTLALIQEIGGKEKAKQAVWTAFILMGLVAICSLYHLAYRPTSHDTSQAAYSLILSPAPRVLFASLIAMLIAGRVDVSLLSSFKIPLWSRFLLATLLSQLLDTLIFTFIALYGLFDHLKGIILLSFSVKVIAILLMAPFIQFVLRRGRAPV